MSSSENNTRKRLSLPMDWRVAFGFAMTLMWITGGVLYLLNVVGANNFIHLPTADIGSFLEGAFAPLAFLWLVIGHFMQQKEIVANTRAIKIQEESARRQELHARRDSFFKLQHLVEQQLHAIAAFHYLSVVGPEGTGDLTTEEFAEERSQMGDVDTGWFVRKMVELAIANRNDEVKAHDIFFGTELRVQHSENFIHTFEKLLAAAQAVDTDNMVQDALLQGSPSGILYRIMKMIKGGELDDSLVGLSNKPGSGLAMPAT